MTSAQHRSTNPVLVVRRDGVVHDVFDAPLEWRTRSVDDLPLEATLLEAVVKAVNARRSTHVQSPTSWFSVTVIMMDAIPLHRTITSVRQVFERVKELFAAQALAANVDLTFTIDDNVAPTLHCDSEKLIWILTSVVGTTLRKVVGMTRRGQVQVHVQNTPDYRGIQWTIRDNGPGMSGEQLRWLFESDPNTGKRAGVALLMARDVVHAHGGQLDVASEPSRGTVVRFYFSRDLDVAAEG